MVFTRRHAIETMAIAWGSLGLALLMAVLTSSFVSEIVEMQSDLVEAYT